METINTNSIKDKKRIKFARSDRKQDHGTKDTQRIDTYADDMIRNRYVKAKQNIGGLDEYQGPDSINELIYEPKAFTNVDDEDLDIANEDYGVAPDEAGDSSNAANLSPDETDHGFESDADYEDYFGPDPTTYEEFAELMGSNVSPEEIAIGSLRANKKRHQQQAGREMGDYDD